MSTKIQVLFFLLSNFLKKWFVHLVHRCLTLNKKLLMANVQTAVSQCNSRFSYPLYSQSTQSYTDNRINLLFPMRFKILLYFIDICICTEHDMFNYRTRKNIYHSSISVFASFTILVTFGFSVFLLFFGSFLFSDLA